MPHITPRFQKGQSGNPGGRSSIAKALAANGTSAAEVTAEVLERLLEALRTLNPGTVSGGASWRFAAQTLLHYAHGKPKEQVEIKSELSTEEYQSALLAITRDVLRTLPAEERDKLLSDPVPTDTIQ